MAFELVTPVKNQKIDQNEPVPKSGHCATADEAYMYVFGGRNPSIDTDDEDEISVVPELWKFNFCTKVWSKVDCQEAPYSAASSSMLLLQTKVSSKVLIFAGTSDPGLKGKMSNDISLCNTSGGRWEALNVKFKNSNVPAKRFGQSLLAKDGYLYLYGGIIHPYPLVYTKELYRFNIGELEWEKISATGEAPEGCFRHGMVYHDDKLYIIGGKNVHHVINLKSIPAYSIKDNNWSIEKSFPDPSNGFPSNRYAFAYVQVGNEFFIFGGFQLTGQSSFIFFDCLSDVWKLSLNTLQWERLKVNMPKKLCFHTAVVSPSGYVYIYGGIERDQTRNSQIFKLKLFVPKLSECCWDYLTNTIHNLQTMPQPDLVDLGISEKFSKRLL